MQAFSAPLLIPSLKAIDIEEQIIECLEHHKDNVNPNVHQAVSHRQRAKVGLSIIYKGRVTEHQHNV